MAIRFKDTISINEEYTFPLEDGTADQVLATDGAGNISFVNGGGETVKIECKNTSGSTITKGTPVYVTGTVGTSFRVQIAPADASDSAKMPAVGLLQTDLANNGEGYVVTGGLLKNLTTDPIDGTNTTSNDTIYVKAGGGLTMTKPTGSNLIQNIGKVGRVNSSNAGSIVVSSILRTNDVPNLTEGKIWVGSADNTIESTVVYIDETNTRIGINQNTPDVTLDITGTDAIQIPKGTDAERPTPESGMLRFNTTSAEFEGYDGTEWGAIGGSEVATVEVDSFTGDGTTVDYTLTSEIPDEKTTQVYIDGVYQSKGNYSVSGTTLTFSTAPPNGTAIEVVHFTAIAESTLNGSGTANYVTKWQDADTIANSIIYDNGTNVGISTATPTQKLEINGTTKTSSISVNANTNIISDNTVLFGGAYGASLYTDGAGFNIGVGLTPPNGGQFSSNFVIDSSGNVGIGTTSPNSPLQFKNIAETRKITLWELANNNYEFYGFGVESNTLVHSVATTGDRHVFFAGSSTSTRKELMRIDGGGDISFRDGSANEAFYWDASAASLSIGAGSAPNAPLHIYGKNQTNGTLELQPNSAKGTFASYVHYGTNGDWYIRSASASGDVIIQDTGGNVGIGTTSPSVPLTVQANSGGIATRFLGRSFDGYSFLTFRNNADSATNGEIGVSDAQNMLFYTGTTERMRIDSSGRLLVGKTSSSYSTEGVEIRSDEVLITNNQGTPLSLNRTGNDGTLLSFAQDTSAIVNVNVSGNNLYFDMTAGGNVGIGTTSPSATLHTNVTGNNTVFRFTRDTGTNGRLDLDFSGANSNFNSLYDYTFQTDGTERMRITSGGDVLMQSTKSGEYTALELYNIHGSGGSQGSTTLTFSVQNSIAVKARSSIKSEERTTDSNLTNLIFSVSDNNSGNPAEAFRLTGGASAGNPTYLRMASGTGGIQFGGDTAAANALDDYEEGTWTITYNDKVNVSSVSTSGSPKYTKIGNVVHLAFEVSGGFTATGTETYFSFTLPFTAYSTVMDNVGTATFYIGTGANRFGKGSVWEGTTSNGKTFVYIPAREIQQSGTWGGMRVSLTYFTA